MAITRGKVALVAVTLAAAIVYWARSRKQKRQWKPERCSFPATWSKPLSVLPTSQVEVVVDCKCLVGECATWSTERQCLYWVDIEGRALYQLEWTTRNVTKWTLPKRAGALALRPGPLEQQFPFLMAFEDGFELFNPETGNGQKLESPYAQDGNVRLNDGRCDRQGRFLCGGINLENVDEPVDVWLPRCGAYRVDRDGKARAILPEHVWRNYNGTAFSPDGRMMYVTDSPLREIWKYDYDIDTGTPSNRRIFARVEPPFVADGAAMDSDGCVWYCKFLQGQVTRYSTDGAVLRAVDVPFASRTTCPCIGGPDLDTLFVTSLRRVYLAARQSNFPDWVSFLPTRHCSIVLSIRPLRFHMRLASSLRTVFQRGGGAKGLDYRTSASVWIEQLHKPPSLYRFAKSAVLGF
ncbi:unnamed protein product [Phaeothamnion confervicola]